MEEFTSPRRGRPPKALGLSNSASEGQSATDADFRERQDGADRIGAQENVNGADWEALVEALKSNRSHKRSVAMAYHPKPVDNWVSTITGWVRVTVGETGYTLNTGETVRI